MVPLNSSWPTVWPFSTLDRSFFQLVGICIERSVTRVAGDRVATICPTKVGRGFGSPSFNTGRVNRPRHSSGHLFSRYTNFETIFQSANPDQCPLPLCPPHFIYLFHTFSREQRSASGRASSTWTQSSALETDNTWTNGCSSSSLVRWCWTGGRRNQ